MASAASDASAQNNQTNHKNLLASGLARGVAFSALALAVAPFILAVPAHAADDNTVSIAVDQNAALQPTGTLYKATTNVTVKTGKPYGFNLTMQADTADLVNSKDQTHKISATPSSTPVSLNANQWGYSLSKSATTFSAIPAGTQATPAVVADVTKAKPAGCTNPANCTKSVTFAANVDPAKLAGGSYSTAIIYTATAKPKPAPTVDTTICKSGNPKNDCQVDIDPNMIPVKYTGSTTHAEWTSLAKPEDSSNQGNWYNYNNKQWANAITVKDPSKYKNQTKVVDQSDILGYWVYIPRYAYEVMRRDGTDKPVSAQNFLISFEKTTTPKRQSATCPEKGKDYRTQCDLDRSYIKGQPSNAGTWATHPAFTFGAKELNGIWFAKFETTGTTTQPTVLPNEAHISGKYSGMNNQVGNFYSLSKTLGINDPQNVGGSGFTTTQNNHHLATLSSHMVNNNDWGAATYLSASKYGAGYNKVQINSSAAEHTTYGDTYSITGCGPWENGNTDSYTNSNNQWVTHKGISVGNLGTQKACSTDNPQRAYNGTLGQLASTTNNPTGIYDMSGGGDEYAAASYSDNLNNSNTNYYFGSNAAHSLYVNTYNFKDFNSCTYQTCGGQALHETHNGSSSTGYNMWLNQYDYFLEQNDSSYSWFQRGGNFSEGSRSGLFYAHAYSGDANYYYAFRVALAPTLDSPKPKYTTNGCSTYGNSSSGCLVAYNNNYAYEYVRDDDWVPAVLDSSGSPYTTQGVGYGSKIYEFDYEHAKWALLARVGGENKYKYVDPYKYVGDVSMMAYVPKFVVDGNRIVFCGSHDTEKVCSRASSIFSDNRKYGFWIYLSDLGCGVRGHGARYEYDNEFKRLAKILIDAFGSPCPK